MGVFTSTSVGGYNYIHYWYEDYVGREGKSEVSNNSFEQWKKQTLYKQIGNFKARTRNMVHQSNGNIAPKEDIDKTLRMFTDPSLNAARAQIFDAQLGQSGQKADSFIRDVKQSGIGGYSYGELASNADVAAKMTALANDIQTFIDTLLKNMDAAFEIIGPGSQVWRDLVDEATQAMVARGQAENTTIGRIVYDYLTAEASGQPHLVDLPGLSRVSSNASFNSAVGQLASLVPAIKNVASGESGLNKQEVGTFYSKIASRVSGIFNTSIGTGLEAAQEIAEINIQREVQNTNNRGLQAFASAGFKVISSANTGEDKNASGNVNTSDVNIKWSNGNLVIEYGISVKNYKLDYSTARPNVRHLNLKTSIDFLEAVRKAGLDYPAFWQYFFNVGAGHSSRAKQYNSGWYADQGSVSAAGAWNQIKQRIAIGGLLAALGGHESEKTLFLAVNGRFFPLDEVLLKAMNSDAAATVSGLSQKTMQDMNKWILKGSSRAVSPSFGSHGGRDRGLAEERSSILWSQLWNYVSKAKVNILLNNFVL